MRYLPMTDVQPGMCVAHDIFDSYGRVLVGKDVVLTVHYISLLQEFGFTGLYIWDDFSSDIHIEEMISAKLRAAGLRSVRERDVDQCKKVARGIVKEIIQKGNICLDMADMRGLDQCTYAHSVNVAILSCMVGYEMGFSEEELAKLVLAGLLHDLGKLVIPSEILEKPQRLTQEEFKIMKSHALISYDIIKDREDISEQVKQAVLCHHENVDGSGYPQGIEEEDISIFAKIIHVVDVYDALVSNRPYKKPYSPCEASEYLMGGCGTLFDQNVVASFLKNVPLYPKGTLVETSDGRKAMVVENKGIHNMRPCIRFISDGTELDLSDDAYFNITILAVDDAVISVNEFSEEKRKEMMNEKEEYHILVLDGDAQQRELFEKALGALYHVKMLKSMSQTMIYLDRNELPDLIIMDIHMEEKDGVNCAEKILEITERQIPLLVVTDIRDKDTVMACRRLGTAGYILKPFKRVFLRAEVKRILTGENDTE